MTKEQIIKPPNKQEQYTVQPLSKGHAVVVSTKQNTNKLKEDTYENKLNT